MKSLLKAVLGTLVFMLWSSSARAATPIHHCTTITAPGAYVLANNVAVQTTGDCIDITVSDVSLSLNGFNIVCLDMPTGCGGGRGINAAQNPASVSGTLKRVNIQGPGNISGFRTGISLQASHSKVQGVTTTTTFGVGIDVGPSSPVFGDKIANNQCADSADLFPGIGIRAFADDSDFTGNSTKNGLGGFEILAGSAGMNRIVDNNVSSSIIGTAGIGIQVTGGSQNLVCSNACGASAIGIYVADTEDSLVEGNTSNGNLEGMVVENVTDSHFKANTCNANTLGFDVRDGNSDNVFRGNTALANSVIDIQDASDTTDASCPDEYVHNFCVNAQPTTCIACITPG